MIRNVRVQVDDTQFKQRYGYAPTRAAIDRIVSEAFGGTGGVFNKPTSPAPKKAVKTTRKGR